MATQKKINNSTEYWAEILHQQWGVKAKLSKLNGEYDLNFLAISSAHKPLILKIMRENCPKWLVEAQIAAMQHVEGIAKLSSTPKVFLSLKGQSCIEVTDNFGKIRFIWVLEYIPGKCLAKLRSKPLNLIEEIGEALGATTTALSSYDNDKLDRSFKWNLLQAGWIDEHLNCIRDKDRYETIKKISINFSKCLPQLKSFNRQVIQNDPNDYNILVSGEYDEKKTLSGIIDFGDMCIAPSICELAIAGAYIVLDTPDPEKSLVALVSGFNKTCPLTINEIDIVWDLLLMRLAVSVVNSTLIAIEMPNDPYVTISQKPAWEFLENHKINEELLKCRLRKACGKEIVDNERKILSWINKNHGNFAHLIGMPLQSAPLVSLAVENSAIPENPFKLSKEEAKEIGSDTTHGHEIFLGYYNEPRLIYTAPEFRIGPYKASNRRTVHLGVDIFAPAGTPILAPLNGEIIAIENRKNTLDYGGMIILKHVADNHGVFYSLYGHLSPNFPEYYKIGLEIKKGQQFCFLGDDSVNGGWAPHLHFQIALTTNGLENDWPGVADPDDLDFFNSICPNPAAILNLPNEKVEFVPLQKNEILAQRKASFGSNLRLSYDEPAMFLRGWKTHLFDEWGRPYLDAYNNVPHVGHSHPRIRNAALEQLKKLNSNTRYLHPKQSDLAESILSKLPETFKVCYFVNSGSEANELALRLAREHTKAKGMITMDHGYFGNTTGAIDISAYKFNKPGGVGQPDWLELVEIPDDYRGAYKKEDPNRGKKFAGQINQAIEKLKSKNQNLCGFIAETFPSVGGQIITPPGYLAEVYRQVRENGGVCIADEVQTGLGRLGNHYFGFEYQKVCPDIVVLGKPIGNGHPVGVVATTKEIANNFDNGIEFFSTFGGSTLSCAIANEVIEIVEDESLQSNARKMGEKLKTGLKNLQNKYDSIGDVRGMGLFVGIELIDENGKENTRLCTFVKNRMRDFRILIGSEGPMDNVIKIRPPLSIELEGINMIIDTLDIILKEETF